MRLGQEGSNRVLIASATGALLQTPSEKSFLLLGGTPLWWAEEKKGKAGREVRGKG